MTAKVRVEDLAVELQLSNKEVIQQLRGLGIQAKSQKTMIEAEDVDRLKAELKQDGGKQQVVRRVGESGVIVRRTRKRTKGKEKEETISPAEDSVEESPQPPAEVVAQAPAEKPVEKTVAETATPKKAEKKPAKKAKKAAKKAAPQVKIIKPVVVEEVPVVEEVTKVTKTPVKEAVVKEAAPEPAPKKTKADSKEKTAKTDTPAEAPAKETKPAKKAKTKAPAEKKEAKSEPKKKKKKKKEPEAPKVKIISMPTEEEVQARTAAKAAAPERRPGGRPGRPGGGRPGGGRPSGGRPSGGRPSGGRPGGGRPGSVPAPVDPALPDGRSKKKKGKKDRRVVEFNSGGGNKPGGQPRFNDGGFPQRNKGRKKKGRKQQMQQVEQVQTQPMKAAKRKVKFDDAIRLADMAHQMGIKAQELIKALFGMGVMATINQSLDLDTAILLAGEFGYEVENVSFDEQEFLAPTEADKPENLKPRPPVVTIMGHVDHGKTSLLDAIRMSHVTDGEAGGITQHIGAYHVNTSRGEIVFLDTPGHEAFTTMRMRGAQVTDLVILVVAADDGVMDQTREAISHSKAADVPILVAVNKMDKEGANPDNVKRELAELGLSAEDWGGDTIFAHVSAKNKTGIDELLELILLQAEVLELKANPDKHARGHIVEARLDKGRGPVGTMLIAEGTINKGDSFVSGIHFGKVRAMFNDQGKKIKSAGPAIPVEIQGFDGLPEAGDELFVVDDEKVARRIANSRAMKKREKILSSQSKVTLESFLASKPDEKAQDLNLVIKADVQGSLEAVTEALNKLSTDEVKINVVHGGAGAITESDILLAGASDAITIGFNVRPNLKVKEIAEQKGVEIRFYDIIYKLVNEIKDAMSGMLAPDIEEVYLGQAEVRDTFSVPKIGLIAGCYMADGKMLRNSKVRLLREGTVIYTGSIASLRRVKDDVKEVKKGLECGMGLEKFNDIKVGDVIEAFDTKEIARTID